MEKHVRQSAFFIYKRLRQTRVLNQASKPSNSFKYTTYNTRFKHILCENSVAFIPVKRSEAENKCLFIWTTENKEQLQLEKP
jgi:hypothetical protein